MLLDRRVLGVPPSDIHIRFGPRMRSGEPSLRVVLIGAVERRVVQILGVGFYSFKLRPARIIRDG